MPPVDLKAWVELVGLIAMIGAFMNQVRVMQSVIREHGARIAALEDQTKAIARIDTALAYMNGEVQRIRNRLDIFMDRAGTCSYAAAGAAGTVGSGGKGREG